MAHRALRRRLCWAQCRRGTTAPLLILARSPPGDVVGPVRAISASRIWRGLARSGNVSPSPVAAAGGTKRGSAARLRHNDNPGATDPADPVTLHHVALYVSDLDRTRTFYCDVLSMHEISRPADFTSPGGPTSSAVPPRCTSLWKPLPAAPPSCAHPGLQTNYEPATASILRSRVPSLDTYRDIFAGSCAAPVGGPRIRADSVEQIYLADPDGHIIELLCRLDQPVADQRRAELAASGEGIPVAPRRQMLKPPWPTWQATSDL
jgi:glyoxylase I family protein